MGGLDLLIVAMAAFVATHLALSHPLRAPLVARLGETGFLGLYSLVAFATFGAMILARRALEAVPSLWVAPGWAWDAATLAMLFASVLLAGSFFANPAAPDPAGKGRARPIGAARGVYAITRHPMMWSFAIWALVHIILWGSPVTLAVAGGIGLLAIVGAVGQDAKKRRLDPARWGDWAARTSFIPFAGQLSGRICWRAAWPGARALLIGIAIFLVATWAHAPSGAPAAGIWRWLA